MSLVSVPYFMGKPMTGFAVPEPHVTLIPELPDADAFERMGELYGHLADFAERTDRPMSYAGDCVSSIGILAGLQRRNIQATLIWMDAHGDFNTPETSPSGFPGGMPLAMLTGRGNQTVVDAVGLTPLSDDQVVLVDARDLDPGEDTALAGSGIRHVTVTELSADALPKGPIHVHLDTDIIDPTDMPALNYPVPNGPSLKSVGTALARLADSGQVVAVSVSSWNPALPGADTAARATRTLIAPFLT